VADQRERLADRIRAALAGDRTTREVRMFGGLSFMVDERMVVAAQGEGDLLVRIDPTRNAELTALPGVSQAEMGSGRTMGPGWISVARDAIGTDQQLSFWIAVAMEHHAASARDDR
jgi:TfoX/Sxy family transcriptional regulator of competence genes